MEAKIDETYHVVSCCCCPQYVYEVLGKKSLLHLSFIVKWLFFPKLRVRIEENNYSPHGKFHRFLFPFSSKSSDLNFASYVLYILFIYLFINSVLHLLL